MNQWKNEIYEIRDELSQTDDLRILKYKSRHMSHLCIWVEQLKDYADRKIHQ